jgi:hypothetical protein
MLGSALALAGFLYFWSAWIRNRGARGRQSAPRSFRVVGCDLAASMPESRRCAACFYLAILLLGLAGRSAPAQGPIPNPNRSVHPSIAQPAFVVPPPYSPPSSPYFALPDGIWNNGEGFGANPADHGGWFGNTDGTNVTLADVHVETWVPHPQASPLMMRMEGYLRPAGLPLPQVHPIYGDLGQGNGYVDQGAFELFKPLTVWPGIGCQKILVVIHCWETLGFPKTERKFSPRLLYRGLFSQDGLARHEPAGGHSVTSFLGTDGQDGDEVLRPALETITHYASNVAI